MTSLPDLPRYLQEHLRELKRVDERVAGNQGILRRGTWDQPGRPLHGREIMLKVLRTPTNRSNREAVWRFWRSADPLYVTRLLYAESYEGFDFEVTEYHPLGSLRDLAHRRPGPVTEAEARQILTRMSLALRHLTEQRIIHGDLKPANILVSREQPITPLLVDFGVSEQADATFDVPTWRGSANYLAPERRSGTYSTKNDWWSLGVIMLELLIGRYPFPQSGPDPDVKLAELFELEDIRVAPLLAHRRDTGARWVALIEGMLTHSYAKRWNHEQVMEWLSGKNPAPRKLRVRRVGFEFGGYDFERPAELGRIMRENWQQTGQVVTSIRIEELAKWVAANQRSVKEPADSVRGLSRVRPVDLAIVHVTTWLDPTGPAMFRSFPLDGTLANSKLRCRGLALLARAALEATALDEAADDPREAVMTLWRSRALRNMPGQARRDLVHVDDLWQALYREAQKALVVVPGYLRTHFNKDELVIRLLRVASSPTYITLILDSNDGSDRDYHRYAGASWLRTLRDRAVPPGRYTHRPEHDAYQVVLSMFRSAPIEDAKEVPDDTKTKARAHLDGGIASLDAEIIRMHSLAPAKRPGVSKRTLRAGSTLAVFYALLAVMAGVGVALGTSPAKGVWTATFLCLMAAWVVASTMLAKGRVSRALLGGWVGGVVGLPIAAAAAYGTDRFAGPTAAWQVFSIGWVAAIIAAGVWGAAE